MTPTETTSIRSRLGEALKKARILAGYPTAKAFAAIANVPATTYSQHETGKRGMTLDILMHYAICLKVSLDRLLTLPINEGLGDVEGGSFIPYDEDLWTVILQRLLFMLEQEGLDQKDVWIELCLDAYQLTSKLQGSLLEKEKIVDLVLSSFKTHPLKHPKIFNSSKKIS